MEKKEKKRLTTSILILIITGILLLFFMKKCDGHPIGKPDSANTDSLVMLHQNKVDPNIQPSVDNDTIPKNDFSTKDEIIREQPQQAEVKTKTHRQPEIREVMQPEVVTEEKGVLINGVRWATCNIDLPGTFTKNPEDKGMLYQWNRKKAWPVTGNINDWNNFVRIDSTWLPDRDPSPEGWRISTLEEIKTLCDKDKVTSEWVTENDVQGRRFTDKANGNSIFLPMVGYRCQGSNVLLYHANTNGLTGAVHRVQEGLRTLCTSIKTVQTGMIQVGLKTDSPFAVQQRRNKYS
jgi:hypothetical protein